MRAGWRGMGKFWRTRPFVARKRLVFQSRAIGAAVSGLEARVLTRDQGKKLDSGAARYAGASRHGDRDLSQVERGGEEERWKVTTICAEAGWKKIKAPPRF